MKTDIQIAQEAQLEHISKIGQKAGINDEYIEFYGNYKAKVDLEFFRKNKNEDGKLILVTAITPTAAGEGKTTEQNHYTTLKFLSPMAKKSISQYVSGYGSLRRIFTTSRARSRL